MKNNLKTCRRGVLLTVSAILITSLKTFGATAGFNQTAAGPWDYNNTANWVGGTINGIWDTSLTLSAAQTATFAADTTLSTGLTFNCAGNFGLTLDSSSTTAHTLTLGGDLSLNTSGGTSANVTIGNASSPLSVDLGSANRTFTVWGSRTLTIVNPISSAAGAYGITNVGLGTLTLSGANTYTGPTVLSAGTLTLSGSISSSSPLVFNGNATLSYTHAAGGSQSFAGATLGGYGAVGNATSGNTVGLGTVTRNAGGILNVSSTTGSTTLGNAVDATGILGAWATVLTGTSLQYAAGGGGGAISAYSGATAATAGTLANVTSSSVNYSFGAAATQTAAITANTLRFTGAGAMWANGGFGVTLNGLMNAGTGPLTNNGTGVITIGANKELVIIGNTQGTTIGSVIADNGGGASSVVYGGPSAGALTLTNGASTFSGGFTLDSGILWPTASSIPTTPGTLTSGPIGTGSLTLNGGTLQTSGTTYTLANNVVVNGVIPVVSFGNNVTLAGAITGGGVLDCEQQWSTGGSIYINGDISGFSGTVKAFTSSGPTPNVNLGGTTANSEDGRKMKVWNTGASGSVNRTLSLGNATGGPFLLGDLSGALAYGKINLNNQLFVGYLGLVSSYPGYIAGAYGLTKVGAGTLILSGPSTYTGGTTNENGILVAGANVTASAAGPFGNAATAIMLGDATTISSATAMNPQLLTGGAFTIGRGVTVGANNNALGNGSTTFTLGGNTTNSSIFSGAISLNQNLTVSQVAGGTLTLSGGIGNATSGAMTVTFMNNGPVIVSTNAVSNGTQGGTVALTVNGTSTVTLTNAHTYTGNTTVSGGTLLVNGSTASGSTVAVSGSGSVLGGSGVVGGNATISSSGALTPRSGGGSATTTTFGGNLTLSSASANFTLSTSASGANDEVVYGSSGTLTLDNTDTINISGTTFDPAGDYTLFTSSGGTVSMATAPTLKINGVTSDQTSAGSYQLVVSGSLLKLHYIQSAAPPTVNSASAAPTSLGHYQSTIVTVNVTPQPGQTISSVNVTLDQLGGAGDSTTLTGPGGDGTGNWTGTFTVPVTLAAGSYTISGTVNQNNGSSAAWSVAGITVTNSSPTWNGSGADNKWSTGGNWNDGHGPGAGDTVAFGGSTQLTNNLDASVSLVSLTFNANAGSFDITNAASTLTLTAGLTNNSVNGQTLDVPVALSGAQTISVASGKVTINGAVSDSATGFTLAGSGTLTLSAANTYSGPTTISSGLLAITGSGSLGSGAYSAGITDNGSLSYSSSAAQTLSGIISGTGSVTNSGSGTLTLSGANSYSGGATVNSGTLKYGNASAFGSGTVTLNGGTIQAGGGYTLANNFTVSGASALDAAGNNTTLGGNIGGSSNLTLNNTGAPATLTLSGNNAGFSGMITVNNNNAVNFTSTNAGSSGAAWVFNDSTGDRVRINIGNGAINFGSISGSGQMQNDTAGTAATISVGALNTSTTFGGTIKNGTGTIALTKVGSGTLTLSGVNTYTGDTVVSNGTLLANGSIAGAATVKGGALGGSGTISNSVTVQSAATLVPGTNGVGTLTVTGNITLNLGSTNIFDVNGSTSAHASVAAGGAVTYDGLLKIVPSGAFTAGQEFQLFSGAGATNVSNFASIAGSPGSGLAFSFTNGVLSVVSAGPSGPATMTNSYDAGTHTLSFSWPAGQGWRLVSQTNSVSSGLNANPAAWNTVPGYTDGSYSITTDPAKPTVFYRLVYP